MPESSLVSSAIGLLWNTKPAPIRAEVPSVIAKVLDAFQLPPNVDLTIRMPSKRQAPKQIAYRWQQISRPGYEKAQFNLAEIGQAVATESYASRSVDKHREHVLRHGWRLVGRDNATINYIHKRFAELGESMNRPLEGEIRQAIRNFIKYSNFFLFWARNRNKPYKDRFRVMRGAMTGLFSMNPESMRFRRDKRNRILEWHQVVGNEEEMLKPADVVHGAFDREDGFILGTPYILPVLDDILTWRRFEEMSEIMAHKFAYPLFHHKIGDEANPPMEFDDNTSEIQQAELAVSNMAPEGHLFTSYRHVVEVVGAKAEAMDLKENVEYWENRVLAGLNLSPLDVGRGDTANRSTAQTISKGLADRCAEYQSCFAEVFDHYVLDELLLEGGYELTPANRVHLFFPPIDQEARRAEDNHLVALYQANVITHDELRVEMGREQFTEEDWEKSFWKQISLPSALVQAVDENSGLGAKIASQPVNQHGQSPTKPAIAKDSLGRNFQAALHLAGKEDKAGIALLRDSLVEAAKAPLFEVMEGGVKAYNDSLYVGEALFTGFMEDCVRPAVNEIVSASVAQYDTNPQAAVSALYSRLKYYSTVFQTAAYNYGFARIAQIKDEVKYVQWKLTDEACDECKEARPMKIRRFTLGQMIPRHEACVDGLEPLEGK